MLRTIKDIEIDEKRVFIRCDFNVPKDEFGNITDDRRIRSALHTIRYCIDRGCKIILASHYERPEPGKYEEKYSLRPIAKRLHTLLKIKNELYMANDVVGPDAKEKASKLQEGDILMLENLRYEAGETANDETFAKELASFADVYINDAFGACHRKHASIYAIAMQFDKDHKAAGFLLSKEVNFFGKVLESPIRPFIAVVGGSKVSGKLQALNNLLNKVDKVIIGGGMAFTFLKAQGYEIGKSLVEDDLIGEARDIMEKAHSLGVKFYLPVDFVVAPEFSENTAVKYLPSQEIPHDWMGLDTGPASSRLFREVLNDAQTIIWNGPMGVYEMDKFSKGSIMMSHHIAETHATTIVGGGDTADVAQRAGDVDEMTFVSTGGGASLKLIEGVKLPGIEALEN
ncbi:phosphoglycerate kinase [Sulfurovum lithotrophicum]|uniref:Phosphoglycerate kinase n=1 Tax=Sulfurovum lithotrophicum TaxID=206403 RepID=A0A7U4RPU8_9BACT|nr:phosphoglycerate kinase [Sulfurovum lithotrophicum]AKF24071.1 phosphoglycerate kinase [Sulfurovum lithotrophicum]